MDRTSDLEGKTVRLIYCGDPYSTLPPGLRGVVQMVDDGGTVHVRWRNGVQLGLIPNVDRFEVVEEE